MTKIAQEARELADTLDKKAEDIVSQAAEAKNKSDQAYEVARNASNKQSEISDSTRKLRHEVSNLENKLNRTKEWTQEVANKSLAAKNNALTLLSEAKNLVIPDIDVPALKERSKILREEAQRLSNETDQLFENSNNLRKTVDEKNEKGRQLLDKAYEQQSEMDDLLNDIFTTKEMTDNSINRWNKILNETESIYKDLKGKNSKITKLITIFKVCEFCQSVGISVRYYIDIYLVDFMLLQQSELKISD